ncbi:hypothetical protein EST38_g10533 [Candolleomyces aberdarensis]|uniref:Major facilitator superfamily (MFS) profile domain-containing protein n=1 Tax=Candolleomyces aberdarensis TaxID=2316362 RepID=A0A4Q2D740_9AGAR|nr:hypothetical protein EST38_g10533 [Candolleomyces aberdarensis]
MASGLLVLNATFASSSPSGIFPHIVKEFQMSEKLGVLTLSLFVTGYCVGPMLWGPLSELYGRRPIHVWPYLGFMGFLVGAALAPNTASILVFRFLAGTFAAAPLTNTGALISDVWDADMRGKALAIFAVAPFAGPALGPTVAGFIGDNSSWRNLFWVVAGFGHGFNAGISGLMLLPIPIGGVLAVILYISHYNPQYEAEMKRLAPKPVPPEFRLDMTFVAGPLFAVSFFWFGWTSFPSISFWAPLSAGLLMGFSIQIIFLGLFNYLVDAYIKVAASALASTTIVRSLFGAGFPLFGGDMYKALDPRWASTVIGFIAIALVPIPIVLKRYGPLLRRRSKYCPVEDFEFETETT